MLRWAVNNRKIQVGEGHEIQDPASSFIYFALPVAVENGFCQYYFGRNKIQYNNSIGMCWRPTISTSITIQKCASWRKSVPPMLKKPTGFWKTNSTTLSNNAYR
jgi:hypothetical protein